MAYECLTQYIDNLEGYEITEYKGQMTEWSEAMESLIDDLYKSDLVVNNYREVLDNAGIDRHSAMPEDYPWETMNATEILAFLTNIYHTERFMTNTYLTCVETGLVAACLKALKAIDEQE